MPNYMVSYHIVQFCNLPYSIALYCVVSYICILNLTKAWYSSGPDSGTKLRTFFWFLYLESFALWKSIRIALVGFSINGGNGRLPAFIV